MSLSAKRYVYFWADGVYFSPRLDHDKQCMCVIIGADELGRKELLAIADGYRESAQSWREVLLDLKPEQGEETVQTDRQGNDGGSGIRPGPSTAIQIAGGLRL